MKTSKTIALTAALLGTIGFGGLIRTVYAQSPRLCCKNFVRTEQS